MAKCPTTISDLPEELLLHLISYFYCITSKETQTAAFKIKEQERARQCENRSRQLTLYALCLTSHRIRRIATPTLFASFTGSTTWYSFKSLKLFHRTVSGPASSQIGHIRLVNCLQYIENRSADFLGNSLDSDIKVDGADRMVDQYYTLLADIIKLAPNLRQITIVSLETKEISLWKYIVPKETNLSATPTAIHWLQGLQALCIQVHTSGIEPITGCFRRITSAVMTLPALIEFRASGVSMTTTVSLLGTFAKLQRIEVTECMLSFDDACEILAACQKLRHVRFEWAFHPWTDLSPSYLYKALLRHADTLVTLRLNMVEVRFGDGFDRSFHGLGSLRDFKILESLSLCEYTFLGSDYLDLHLVRRSPWQWLPGPSVLGAKADLLPRNLAHFTLILDYHDHWSIMVTENESATALNRFVDQCKQDLPEMKVVVEKASSKIS